jgi:DNA recombination protein RmuC
MGFAISAVIGLILGIGLGWFLALRAKAQSANSKQELLDLLKAEEVKTSDRETHLFERLQASFGKLSLETMGQVTEQLAKQTSERIEAQQKTGTKDIANTKVLIDAQLKQVSEQLERMKSTVGDSDKSRGEQFATLSTQLKLANERSDALAEQTKLLSETLGSNQARGQWGERMAEDILRAAGFELGVNYRKQDNQDGLRPDFTFLLPQGFVVNMDVKFPFSNFVKVIDAEGDEQRERHTKAFMSDVKTRLKEVSSKAYIDPQNKTVDYVLLFIPNDQVYAFMHRRDPALLDAALSKRIVLCSPGTLFAVLMVIRQAMDSFKLQERSNAMLGMIKGLRHEWEKYSDKVESLKKQYGTLGNTLEDLVGPRHNQLAKQFARVDNMNIVEEPTARQLAANAETEDEG